MKFFKLIYNFFGILVFLVFILILTPEIVRSMSLQKMIKELEKMENEDKKVT